MSEEQVLKEVESKNNKVKNEKKLAKKQLALLKLVYRFRFVNSKQIARYFNQSYISAANSQLTQLYERGYLGKRHDGTYRIQGRPAEYYLATKSRAILKSELDVVSKHELKRLYARPDNSSYFVNRSLQIFDIHLELNRLYGDRLNFFTKSQLNVEQFEYFPKPLPDAFMTISGSTNRNYFVEYFDDDVSIGIHGRKIAGYIKYKESGQWDDTGADFPTVIFVCQSPLMLKKAEKRVRYLDRNEYSEIQFRLIDLDALKALGGTKKKAWIDPIKDTKIVL